MNFKEQCLAEEEILEAASDSTTRENLLRHVNACSLCQSAVDRVRRELNDVQRLFDRKMNDSLALTRPKILAADDDFKQRKSGIEKTAAARLQAGEKLGKYEVREYLGRGGMGEVYRVANPDLDLPLVAKICRIPRSFAISSHDRNEREALLREEARTLARLAGARRIARVHDLELSQHGPFIVMEMVQGRNLAQCFGEYSRQTDKVLRLMIEIGQAIDEAHRAGVVHGDLKPENILVNQSGEVKLIDFGLARIRDAWEQGDSDRVAGGTLKYMAPEQRVGAKGEITPATDIFALGLIFQELLTGSRDKRSNIEALQQGFPCGGNTGENNDTNSSSENTDKLISRCLATNPADRFATGGTFVDAIRKMMAEPAAVARNRRWILWAGLVLVGLVVLVWEVVRTQYAPVPKIIEAEIPGLLGTKTVDFGELEKAIPLTTNDSVGISTVGPGQLTWYVIWIDSEREVFVFSDTSPENRLKTEPVGETGSRISWPSEGYVSLTGPGGTEMVILVGVKKTSADLEQAIRRAIAATVSKDGWPDLPVDSVIRCSRDDVREYKSDGTTKSIGKLEATPVSVVTDTIQAIRKALRDDCEFLTGEAVLIVRPE